MRMKPKSTTLQPKALLYKRFIGIEKSTNFNVAYTTFDEKYWEFNPEKEEFEEVVGAELPNTTRIISVPKGAILTYLQTGYQYTETPTITWVKIENIYSGETEGLTLLSTQFNHVSRYQVNKYYYAGCFDFVVKGSVEGTTTQYIKGNIIPLTSFNIKHFNDDIQLVEDDLVVIDGHLYSVESPETDIKYMPKKFNIYFATLNSVL